MLTNYARWYSFTPPQWPTLSPPLTVAGCLAAVVVALLGDLAARVFNLSVGFQWDFRVHQNLQIIVIGAGAAVGAMLAWGNLNRSTVRLVSSALFVVLAGVAGAYVGVSYGPGVDTSYWWSRYATDITIHFAGAALSAAVAAHWG